MLATDLWVPYYFYYMYVDVCVCVKMNGTTCMGKSEDYSTESILSTRFYMGSRDWTQVLLASWGKLFCLLSHLLGQYESFVEGENKLNEQ